VRVWNLQTGQCQYALTGHTSLVGLLGLSPSHLVSAAADSTLRIWDPDTGELRHTLAAHTGAITCFQHDEFKVLSGSDGNLKMWNIRDGTVVRDLLTGITGVWQVVFEGRFCVAASNQNDATVIDIWDFGIEDDEDWLGEPPGGLNDEDIFSEDEDEVDVKTRNLSSTKDEEQEQGDIDKDLVSSDAVIEIESGQEIRQPHEEVNTPSQGKADEPGPSR
jgi:F-box and WD-40 domain protein CDC4